MHQLTKTIQESLDGYGTKLPCKIEVVCCYNALGTMKSCGYIILILSSLPNKKYQYLRESNDEPYTNGMTEKQMWKWIGKNTK